MPLKHAREHGKLEDTIAEKSTCRLSGQVRYVKRINGAARFMNR